MKKLFKLLIIFLVLTMVAYGKGKNSNNNYRFKGNTLEEREKKRIKRMQYLKNIDDPNAYFEIMAIMEEQDRDEKETYSNMKRSTKTLKYNKANDPLNAIYMGQMGYVYGNRNLREDVMTQDKNIMIKYLEFFVLDTSPNNEPPEIPTVSKMINILQTVYHKNCKIEKDLQYDNEYFYLIYNFINPKEENEYTLIYIIDEGITPKGAMPFVTYGIYNGYNWSGQKVI